MKISGWLAKTVQCFLFMQCFLLTIILWSSHYLSVDSGNSDGKQVIRFRLIQVGDKFWKITFDNAPPNLKPLTMKPESREPEINKGTWLVLAFGVFSVPDTKGVEDLIELLPRLKNDMTVGIRPFWDYEEMLTWFPEYEDERSSPLWAVIIDGKTRSWHTGSLPPDKISLFLDDAFKNR